MKAATKHTDVKNGSVQGLWCIGLGVEFDDSKCKFPPSWWPPKFDDQLPPIRFQYLGPFSISACMRWHWIIPQITSRVRLHSTRQFSYRPSHHSPASNGQHITSSKTGQLFLPHLGTPLRAHIFFDTNLGTSLLSISEVCNNGCIAIFTRDNVHATKDGNTVLNSKKTFTDVLWHVNLPACQDPVAGSTVLGSNTDRAFTIFIHTSYGSPVLSTFLLAVRKGFVAAYPRLTPTMVTAYFRVCSANSFWLWICSDIILADFLRCCGILSLPVLV